MKSKSTIVYLFIGAILVSVLPGFFSKQAAAQSQVEWPDIDLQPIESGLDSPVHLTHAGDDSGRLFVVEQAGRIRIIQNGLLEQPFLEISGRVRSPGSGGGSEEGLLSLAFPPGDAAKTHFYIYYTNQAGNNQVSRFRLSSDPNRADPASEEVILLLEHPNFANHNGGLILFGPDGNLYIGTGDGGGGGDPHENAQDRSSLLGKLLRIDVEQGPAPQQPADHQVYLPALFNQGSQPRAGQPYAIPSDNPFVQTAEYRGEIWAYGLRNPWRFSFDRQTGDLYLGDVGQAAWEEINFQPADSQGGENYGWNILEGLECFEENNCDKTGLTLPVHVYLTRSAGSCSVTGGSVYRGESYPTMQGIYLYADYCNGKIWGLQRAADTWLNKELMDTPHLITSFGEDQDGELYIVDHAGGIYQVTLAGNP